MRVGASLVLASALLVGGAEAADAQRVVTTRPSAREQRVERERTERERDRLGHGTRRDRWDGHGRRDGRGWDRHDRRDERRERYEREHARWHRRNDPRWRDRHDYRYEHRGRWEDDYLGGRDGWTDFFGGREYQRMDLGGWGYPGAWVERRGEGFLLFLPDGRSLRLDSRLDARDLLALLASMR